MLGEDRGLRPRRLRAAGALVAVVAVVALALAGCTEAEPPPQDREAASSAPTPSGSESATQPPSEPPRRPRVGECYRLTFAQALAPTSGREPVPCRGSRTAQTAYVGTVGALLDGHLLAVDSRTVQSAIARECPRRVGSYVGASERDLRLSLIRPTWYSPTLAESDRGAMWFRCDVIALAGEKELAPLGPMKGALADGGGDRYAVCGTTEPDDPRFQRVACSQPHTWRAIDSYDVRASSYPGEAALRATGRDVCAAAAEERAGSSLEYEGALDWPTKEQWEAGQHWGLCWAPD